MADIPSSYDHLAAEESWRRGSEEWGIYLWDRTAPREATFVVDTPPPTVSGSLHVGHVFSYTHQDLLVRYQRMIGKNIAYPMGWDDNGLPTERRVPRTTSASAATRTCPTTPPGSRPSTAAARG